MHCRSCDCELSDYEATRKSARTNEYIDLCDSCLDPIREEFELIERVDLQNSTSIEYELEGIEGE